MAEQQQAKFEGWAIVEVMGHQRYVGFVTTEAYGGAVLFRVDVPALPERERVTKRAEWGTKGERIPAGATVKEGAVQGYSKLVGSGSIYCVTPCTEAAAMEALEQMQPRPLLAVDLPSRSLTAIAEAAADDDTDDGPLGPEDRY